MEPYVRLTKVKALKGFQPWSGMSMIIYYWSLTFVWLDSTEKKNLRVIIIMK